MQRRLTAHERALWSRVAATIRPLPGRSPVPPEPLPPPAPVPAAAPISIHPMKAALGRQSPGKRPAATPVPTKPDVTAATLDGSWDRKLGRGRVVPDRVIDLHGHTLADAHARLGEALAQPDGARIILVITGKGRADRPGRIRAELAGWLSRPDLRVRIAALRPAHPNHGGSGAFYLILRR
ncbi:Smr/MutS family protein [Sandarakinorhabdus sp.]|uniref:Smr/MutS family protein n=1 Tax=Sandarakinorhabdus sp. TaxID=1916663 RepID=UPI00286DBB54|nr:Smr/MutS family protein [Sandarakinorhabdus sp.]